LDLPQSPADRIARQELDFTLRLGDAHLSFDDAIRDFPPEHYNSRPPNTPYSFWQLLEHIRFCQWDLLDYVRNPDYQALPFPEGVWPGAGEEADEARWQATVAGFHQDLAEILALVADPDFDLYQAPAHAWEPEHTPFRCFLVAADHNAYHIGELAILRQVMGLWGTADKGRMG